MSLKSFIYSFFALCLLPKYPTHPFLLEQVKNACRQRASLWFKGDNKDQLTKPLVSKLVGYYISNTFFICHRRNPLFVQHCSFSVGYKSPVLHCTFSKSRKCLKSFVIWKCFYSKTCLLKSPQQQSYPETEKKLIMSSCFIRSEIKLAF